MAAHEEQRALLAANRAFYAAFESLDGDRMADIWLRESRVSCIHPGWGRILGWGAVMKSWEDIFASTFGVTIRISDEAVEIRGDVGWVTCKEELETRLYDGVSRATVEATNIFQHRDGRWLLIHHHGSPLVRPEGGAALH
jgi:ketosteroid isomerase-like protein